MQSDYSDIAHSCVLAAYEGSMSFTQIVTILAEAGFEGYYVDYRSNSQTFYHREAESVIVKVAPADSDVAMAFKGLRISQLVRWAQKAGHDYTYTAFCEQIIEAGCAGYLVSFAGKRVVYFGVSGDIHIKCFPI